MFFFFWFREKKNFHVSTTSNQCQSGVDRANVRTYVFRGIGHQFNSRHIRVTCNSLISSAFWIIFPLNHTFSIFVAFFEWVLLTTVTAPRGSVLAVTLKIFHFTLKVWRVLSSMNPPNVHIRCWMGQGFYASFPYLGVAVLQVHRMAIEHW